MEIIEKQIEKVKEMPNNEYYGYGRRDINGKANAGLALGIVGTALGAWNLFGNRGRVFGGNTGLDGANININGIDSFNHGNYAPTAFQTWKKGCEDTLALQGALYSQYINYQNNRFSDRQTIDSELFGLYKSNRDSYDTIIAKHNADSFGLYKSQRDADDSIKKELSDLKAQVAINAAVRPYQDKLIQCEIDKAFTAGINYTDKKTCRMIKGQLILPEKPLVAGYGSYNPCCSIVEED